MDYELSVRFRMTAEARWWVVKVYLRGGCEPCFEATAQTRREALEIGRAWCRARGAASVRGVYTA